jgi:hypothetical protein
MCAPVRDLFGFDGKVYAIADGYPFKVDNIEKMISKYLTEPQITTSGIQIQRVFGLIDKKVILKKILYTSTNNAKVPVLSYRGLLKNIKVVPTPVWNKAEIWTFSKSGPHKKEEVRINYWEYAFPEKYGVKADGKVLISTRNQDSGKNERYVLTFEDAELVKTDLWLPGGDLQGLIDMTCFDYYSGKGFQALYDEGFTEDEIEDRSSAMLTPKEWDKQMKESFAKRAEQSKG